MFARVFDQMVPALARKVPRRYIRDIGWTISTKVLLIPLRMVRFAFLARLLGVHQYGVFNAVSALVVFAAAFSGWGFGTLLVRHVTRDQRSFPIWWGNSLLVLIISVVPLTIFMIILGSRLLSDVTPSLIIMIAGVELFHRPLGIIAERALRARWMMTQAALISVLPEITSVLSLMLFAAVGVRSAQNWAMWQFIGATVATIIVVAVISSKLGKPRAQWSSIRANFLDGTHFAVGQSANSVYTSVDRVMLGRLSTFDATGIYSAALGLMNMARLPLTSFDVVMMPRYFELGGQNVAATARFASRNVFASLIYAVPAGVLVFLCAPFIPRFLGSDYTSAVEAIRWMAALPIFLSISNAAGLTLSAIDRPQDRTKIFAGVALVNIGLSAWLIPHYSWKGAAASTMLSEIILGLCLSLMVWRWVQRSRRNSIDLGA